MHEQNIELLLDQSVEQLTVTNWEKEAMNSEFIVLNQSFKEDL